MKQKEEHLTLFINPRLGFLGTHSYQGKGTYQAHMLLLPLLSALIHITPDVISLHYGQGI